MTASGRRPMSSAAAIWRVVNAWEQLVAIPGDDEQAAVEAWYQVADAIDALVAEWLDYKVDLD